MNTGVVGLFTNKLNSSQARVPLLFSSASSRPHTIHPPIHPPIHPSHSLLRSLTEARSHTLSLSLCLPASLPSLRLTISHFHPLPSSSSSSFFSCFPTLPLSLLSSVFLFCRLSSVSPNPPPPPPPSLSSVCSRWRSSWYGVIRATRTRVLHRIACYYSHETRWATPVLPCCNIFSRSSLSILLVPCSRHSTPAAVPHWFVVSTSTASLSRCVCTRVLSFPLRPPLRLFSPLLPSTSLPPSLPPARPPSFTLARPPPWRPSTPSQSTYPSPLTPKLSILLLAIYSRELNPFH